MNSVKSPLNEETDIGMNIVEQKPIRNKFKKRGLKRFINRRNILIATGFTLFPLLIFLMFFVIKIDSYVFPSELKGVVSATNDGVIGDARVCIGSKCTNTDSSGQFVLKGLKRGKHTLEIHRAGFKVKKETVKLERGKNSKNFNIDYANTGTITGIVFSKAPLKIEELKAIVGEHTTKVGSDGAFKLELVEVGEHNVMISSPNYKDLNFQINLTESGYDLGRIELTSAADVKFRTQDWLTTKDLVVDNLTSDNQISIEKKDSEVTIKDLVPSKALKFQIEKQGYNNFVQEIESVNEGINDLGNIQLVRQGKIVYVSNRTGNQNIYMANIDGSEEVRLTDNKGDSYAPFLSKDSKTVLFLSKRDKVKSAHNSIVPILYSVDTSSKKITKVTTDDYKDNDGDIGNYNLEAGKRIYDRDGANSLKELFVGDVSGAAAKKITEINGYFNSMIVSNSGKSVMFVADYYDNDDKDAVYLYNLASSKSTKIFENNDEKYAYPISVSSDGKYGLINVYEDENNDLILRDFGKGKSTKLTKNSAFESEALFSPDSKTVSYISDRDGKSDIYLISLDGEKETKLTNKGKVSGYFWKDDLIFFTSEQVMYVLDTQNPDSIKEVTKNVFISNYYYAD